MAISQQDRMPSFWFLGRGGFAQKLLLVLGSLLEMVLAGCRRAPESWDRRIGKRRSRLVGISRPARGSTAMVACSSVNGGGKVDHMGGSIVGLRLSTFRGNVRLSVQQKCHLSNPGSYQMSTAPVVRFAAAVYSDPENGPESAPLCPLWPICASPWTVCLSLFVGRR